MDEISVGIIEGYRITSMKVGPGDAYGDRFKFNMVLSHPKAPDIKVHSYIGPGWGVTTISYPQEAGCIIRESVKRRLYDWIAPVVKSLGMSLVGFAGLGALK